MGYPRKIMVLIYLHYLSHLQQNLSQEKSSQLPKTLCEIQRLLISHLGLTCQGRMRSQVARYTLHSFVRSLTVVMKLSVTKHVLIGSSLKN